jgi:hypothetical protein
VASASELRLTIHYLPRLAAGVFAETSQPMSEPFGGSSFRILGDITQ